MFLLAINAMRFLVELGEAPRITLAPKDILEGAVLDILVMTALKLDFQSFGVIFHLFVLSSINLLMMLRLMAEDLFS